MHRNLTGCGIKKISSWVYILGMLTEMLDFIGRSQKSVDRTTCEIIIKVHASAY